MAQSLDFKTKGAAAQYGVSAQSGKVAYDSTNVVPAGPASTITGHVQPGGSGTPLFTNTIQNATAFTVDATAGKTGNALLPAWSQAQGTPVQNAAQAASAGKSLAPEHE